MDWDQDDFACASTVQLPYAAIALLRLVARADGASLPFAHAILAFAPDAPAETVHQALWLLSSQGFIELILDDDGRVVRDVTLTPKGAAAAASGNGSVIS